MPPSEAESPKPKPEPLLVLLEKEEAVKEAERILKAMEDVSDVACAKGGRIYLKAVRSRAAPIVEALKKLGVGATVWTQVG